MTQENNPDTEDQQDAAESQLSQAELEALAAQAAHIKRVVEAALMAADGPLTVANLSALFQKGELDAENGTKQIRTAIKTLQEECAERGVELKRVASGFRFQVKQDLSPWVSRLWEEKPPRYTRALLETLALIAYKQPVTRGDIEQVRGVSVSQNIMRTLVEREWIKVVGQREVPGRPSLYGTTKEFLDYFNLKSLEELPPLPEIRALIEPVLEEGAEAEATQTEDSGQGVDAADTASQDAPEEVPVEVNVVMVDETEVSEDTAAETADVVQLRPDAKSAD